MALVVAPAVVSARRPWIRVLDRGCSCTAVRYLGLVGLVGTLVRLAGSSRRLVHSLLGPGPVTGATGVMHRPPSRSPLIDHLDHCIIVAIASANDAFGFAYHVFVASRSPCGSIVTFLATTRVPAAPDSSSPGPACT